MNPAIDKGYDVIRRIWGGGGDAGTTVAGPHFGGMGNMGGMAGSTLPGQTSSYNPAYGGIPSVPDPAASASSAIGADLGNLQQLLQLAGGVNNFNEGSLLSNLSAGLPGYSNLVGQSSGNIASHLKGEIPDDVLAQLSQHAAERGISTGVGAPNSNAALLRALGLTSIGLQDQGEKELSGAIGRTPVAQPFDFSRLFITPGDVQDAQLWANIYKSAPNPASAAQAARDAVLQGSNRAPVYNPGTYGGDSWAAPSNTYSGPSFYGGSPSMPSAPLGSPSFQDPYGYGNGALYARGEDRATAPADDYWTYDASGQGYYGADGQWNWNDATAQSPYDDIYANGGGSDYYD